MSVDIHYIDRESGKLEIEKVYGDRAIHFLYATRLGRPLGRFIAKTRWFSKMYGWLQRTKWSRHKVAPFIKKFGVDTSNFAQETFSSFDDFFTRKLKPQSRPIDPDPNTIVTPADGRYWVCPDVSRAKGFLVKGRHYCLNRLLGQERPEYRSGALVMVRLCPTDYHRFHFPFDGTPSESHPIEGDLHSVNPLSFRQRISLFTENKRQITELKTSTAGTILLMEVGATCVGTIHQTYAPHKPIKKGDEKGYFSFGGSTVILLFEPGMITLSDDLVSNSAQFIETKCLMGQPLGYTSS